MGVLSLLFRVFRTLQSWLNPVREEPHSQSQQTDHESSSSSSSSSSGSCYDWEEDEASSSSISPSRYDVFLSFRGSDTRNTFTGHLYNRLNQVGIATFMDEKELKEGEEIGPNLLKAIEESRISITIFSLDYASSKWCLDELVHIMECRERSKQQLVLPVFFHVDPRDVRKQKGLFGQAFEKLAAETDDREKVKRWKKALKKAGELKGWHLQNGPEAKLIKEIAGRVSRELENIIFPKAKNLVGIESSVEGMKRLLNVESEGVRIVGICGMGGIGKTTLAHTVFNQIFCDFEGHIFLEDIREVSKHPGGLVSLQKQLISKILDQETQSISDVDSGKIFISSRFRRKKVIVVLDDVDNRKQLEALAGSFDWFGTGSRIVITTRDEKVLNAYKVVEIYKLKDLDFGHSLQLFRHYAFSGSHPRKDLMSLACDVVRTTGGLPLAIKVLGSFLCDMHSLEEWKIALEKLKKNQHNDIMQTLKISYDGLDRNERDIFLDIACFFIGHDEEEATYIWEGCGFFPKIEIRHLRQKSLIDMDTENKFRMHDQLRDMARQIVSEEQPTEPGERSRLWSHEEVLDVLKESTGTKKVKGLLLKLEWPANASEESRFKTKAFLAMSRLRLLQIDNAILEGGFENLSSELRWLCWEGCPLESLPTDFHPEKLVVLDLSYSKITRIWNGSHQNQVLKNIKVLKLLYCSNLTETPDFQRLPNLVVLNLKGCSNLTQLPGSICKLKSLKSLILSSCSILKKLPRDLGDMESLTVFLADKTAIEYLPESIGDLKRLRRLCLNGCESLRGLPDSFRRIKSSIKLELEVLELADCELLCRLPVSIGFAINLTTLTLDRTSITELSNDIVLLEQLKTFSVRSCKKLQSLPELPSSLVELVAEDCSSIERLPDLSNLTNLTKLECGGTSIRELPDALGSLEKLKAFSVRGCKKLKSLPELPLSLIDLFADDCSSMDRLPDLSNLTNMTIFYLHRCKKLQSLPDLPSSLIRLYVEDCSSMETLPDLSNLTNMTGFNLCRCKKLQSLPNLPSSLFHLVAEDCSSMERLPDLSNLTNLVQFNLAKTSIRELPDALGSLEKLKTFDIWGCKKLQFLPELPSSLIQLLADDCSSMERLPDLSNLTNMTKFKLRRCKKLQSLPDLPSSLIHLKVEDCSSMETLPDLSNLTNMTKFKLRHCKKLQSLPDLPSSLIGLVAEGCSSMERLPDLSNLTNLVDFNLAETSIRELPDALGSLEKLETFRVWGCKKLQSLPELPSSLTRLECGGTSITELPNGIALLEKLEHLSVSDCRKLVKLPDAIGRLSSLWALGANNCNLSEGGIPTAIGKLSSLDSLDLDGNNFYSLPATISDMSHLAFLSVENCRNLQSLPELPPSRLIYVNASNCPSLEILPDLSNLKKLQLLNLSNCEKLVNIQGSEGLESLELLHMNGCISVESLLEFPHFDKMYELELGYCEKLVDIQGIEKLGSCRHLNLSGCSRIPADTLRKCIVYMGNQSLDQKFLLCFSGNKTPDWFTPLEIRQEKIIKMVGPSRHSNGEQHHQKKMMEILLCFVFFNPREENLRTNIYINDEASFRAAEIYIRKTNGDQICLLRIKGGEFEGTDEISFILKPSYWCEGKDLPIVKKAGMHVLYYEKEESGDNYTTTVQSAYERIADFFFPLNDGDGESNSSSSHRKRNNSHLLSNAREGGYFFAGKSKRQKKE